MANQPFYHLRPNKYIDRYLFVQTLQGLSRLYPIEDYKYTGFGSYLFDDFKVLHEVLNISKMTSLEEDPNICERADFNRPYACITIEPQNSTAYLAELLIGDEEHNIFWLDFVAPSLLGSQLSDYSTLLSQLNVHDIVRITLNANPDSLGKNNDPNTVHEKRLKTLRERVPAEYINYDVAAESVTAQKYPHTLLSILKAATLECFGPYDSKYLLPLFATVYADGQQMLTFTGVVLEKGSDEDTKIKDVLKPYTHHSFNWDDITKICVPSLSSKEIFAINKLLPSSDAKQQLQEKFSYIFTDKEKDSLESYISFYKYYPNYHHVSF